MRIEHGLLPGHVLQRTPRGARATVTGTCAVDGPVLATVRKGAKALPGFKAKRVGAAEDGRFSAVIAGLPTGGPYTVELACGRARAAVAGVLVGDLWLMAGQSNMEGIGDMAAAPAPHPLVRNFSMARRWEEARDPLHFLAESPDPIHGTGLGAKEAAQRKRAAKKGVGVGVFFGKLMHSRSKVPQGLIATAHGGTSMAQWDPALKDRAGASLYGSMWLSLQAVGQPVAGVLWYQGCSDADREGVLAYTRRMQDLVAAVRRDLGQPELPWIIVQIGRVVVTQPDPVPWNAIQEQQRLLPRSIAHLDVVPAVDLDLDDLIHVSGRSFSTLAERMALVAARLVLGDRGAKPALQPAAISFHDAKAPHGPTIEVRIANVVGGLVSAGRPLGFSIVDRNRKPVDLIHKVTLAGDRAILHLTSSSLSDHQLMYGCGTNPACNIGDQRGMAMPIAGPLPIAGLPAVSPWFLRWRVTPIRPGEDISGLQRPSTDDAAAADRVFPGTDFVNCHEQWMKATGHVGFNASVEVAEDMEVEVRTGYDGPFRLWVGDREVHTDLAGTNPAILDTHRIRMRLARGKHAVSVLMALNNGRAWGFFLRIARTGCELADGKPLPQPWG